MICKICEKEYDLKETKRVYGDASWTNGICSAGCYTISVTMGTPAEQTHDKAVVIFSGGMDSTVLLTSVVRRKGSSNVEAINFHYGSKHNDTERRAAKAVVQELNVLLRLIDLDFMHMFKSDLLKGGGDIPQGHYEDESMKATVVPCRNMIMIAIAAGYAESIGASAVYLGSHAGDHAIYPDCRPEFNLPMGAAVVAATDSKVTVRMPFEKLSKADLVTLGTDSRIKAPLHLTWSCYEGREWQCGKCGTCVERIEAFMEAGYIDPVKYEIKIDWGKRLPYYLAL